MTDERRIAEIERRLTIVAEAIASTKRKLDAVYDKTVAKMTGMKR